MDAIQVVMVEDEPEFRVPVQRYLAKRGMAVHAVNSIPALESLLDTITPDVILLDVGLPGEDGLSAVSRLRSRTTAGLVMLTGRADTDSRIRGRRDGADGYLSKPVDLRELEAVILSLMRRIGAGSIIPTAFPTVGVWTVDVATWRLLAPNGKAISLSAAQWAVVDLLTRHQGTPVHRDTLMTATGLTPRDSEDRRLDVLMSRLRNALVQGSDNEPCPIQTVRNVGYVFSAAVQRLS